MLALLCECLNELKDCAAMLLSAWDCMTAPGIRAGSCRDWVCKL